MKMEVASIFWGDIVFKGIKAEYCVYVYKGECFGSQL